MTAWTREDVQDLHTMSVAGNTISEIARHMDRSRRSVIQALKRVQTQQALFHPMHEVAAWHSTDLETLAKRLKDPLFYIPLQQNEVPLLLVATSVIFGLVSLYGNLFYRES